MRRRKFNPLSQYGQSTIELVSIRIMAQIGCPGRGSSGPVTEVKPATWLRARHSQPMTHSGHGGDPFDHLVSAGEQLRRHGETERLSGFEVDGQLDVNS